MVQEGVPRVMTDLFEDVLLENLLGREDSDREGVERRRAGPAAVELQDAGLGVVLRCTFPSLARTPSKR